MGYACGLVDESWVFGLVDEKDLTIVWPDIIIFD